ncbi:MAG: extracellular solute-binding protein [Pseudomonadota bacterium]
MPAAHATRFSEAEAALAETVRSRLRNGNSEVLRLLHPDGCEANLAPVAQAFNDATGMRVELVKGSLEFIGSELRFNDVVKTSANAYDLALPATYSLPDLVGEALLRDLSEFAREHEPPWLQEEMLYTLGDYFDGGFYGYQTDGDAYLAFFNYALPGFKSEAARYADRYGIQLSAPKTWLEMDRQIRHFHKPDAGVYGGSLYRTNRYTGWEFWSRLHGKGVLPVSDDFVPQFQSAAGVEALQELIAVSTSLEPAASTNGLFDNFKSFAEGNKFVDLGWGGTQKFLQGETSRVRGNLAHGVLPGGVDSTGRAFAAPIFNWGWNFVVPVQSPNPELAYLFSLFATLPTMSTLSVRQQGGYFDPHQRVHYTDSTIADIYGHSFLTAHERSMSQCIPDFHVYVQERYMRILGEAVHAATRGFLRPDIALREAANQWERLTDDCGREKQTQQWRQLKTSYPTRILEVAQ